MDFYTDFACGMVSCPSTSLVKVLIFLIIHSSWKKFWPLCWCSMNHKMSAMLMKHLYITSVYLTGLMHLSMRGCVYSQSGWIPTGRITASRITFVFFFVLLRSEDQSNGTPRTVLVSCLLLTWQVRTSDCHSSLAKLHDLLHWKRKMCCWKTWRLSIITTPEPGWMVQSFIHTWKTGMMS